MSAQKISHYPMDTFHVCQFDNNLLPAVLRYETYYFNLELNIELY